MKLLIGIPSYDYIHAEFVKCLNALILHLARNNVNFDVFINNGTLVHVARDKIACKAINEGFTHVLWLDSDMIFYPEVFDDLMDTRKDFVCGIFFARRKPHSSCLFKQIDDISHIERIDDFPLGVFEIEACGFGCVLTATEVLKHVQTTYQTCFTPMASWGEDLAFCKRARGLGHRIFADSHVQIGHIGHEVIYKEDHDKYIDLMKGG